MAEIDGAQFFGSYDVDKVKIEDDMLDFVYIDSCSDWKTLLKILDTLRSGKDGHFPEVRNSFCLTEFVNTYFLVD
jgi:hypothetical protein